jgi:hypothetical protein
MGMKRLILAAAAALLSVNAHAQKTDGNGNGVSHLKHYHGTYRLHVLRAQRPATVGTGYVDDVDYTPFYMKIYQFPPYGD